MPKNIIYCVSFSKPTHGSSHWYGIRSKPWVMKDAANQRPTLRCRPTNGLTEVRQEPSFLQTLNRSFVTTEDHLMQKGAIEPYAVLPPLLLLVFSVRSVQRKRLARPLGSQGWQCTYINIKPIVLGRFILRVFLHISPKLSHIILKYAGLKKFSHAKDFTFFKQNNTHAVRTRKTNH